MANDGAANELGVKFSVAVPGTVSAIQFYRGAADPGPFTVHLWDSQGDLLGTGQESGNAAPGWQTVALGQPVALTPGVTYVASYYTSDGGYADAYNFFTGANWSQGPLAAPPSGGSTGGNGVFAYGGGFPTQSYLDSNYWVGPVFQPAAGTAPTVTGLSQTNTGTAGGVVVTITGSNFFSGHVTVDFGDAQSTNFTVIDDHTLAALVPAHAAGTVDVRVVTDGGASDLTTADQLTYVSATPPSSAISLFDTTDPTFSPPIPVANDGAANELGVKFSVAVPGTVSAIQFYRGAADPGPFTVHLWDSQGDLLGTGQETGNAAPGWQTVALTQPVALTPGVTYVASYYTPDGGYADAYNFFTGASWSQGPLAAPASNISTGGNGLFAYGGGFPTQSYRDSNYWVGPIFQPAAGAAPTVTGLSQTSAGTAGGVVVTITGSNFFSGHVSVDFGDAQSANFTVIDDHTLAALVPAHAVGTVDVRVVTDAGASNLTTADQLTYIAPNASISPNAVTLFETTDPSLVPAIPVADDTNPQELGVKFTVAVPGTVTAIQFYRGAPSDSGFTVHLWDSTGSMLGTGQVPGNQAPGWQTVFLNQPVHLSPFVTYVASYYTPDGGYPDTYDYFATNGISHGPLLAFSSSGGSEAPSSEGPNGVFFTGLGGGFPTQSYRNSNYWVSPVFVPDASVGQPPVITSISLSSGSGGILLTINGANFTPDAIAPSVYFGATEANLHIFSANQIIVFVPDHPAGTVNIRVVTDAGESSLTLEDLFTYMS